jgi:hypothetical protein
MQTPYRGQPKIVVTAAQNVFPHVEVVKPVRLADRIEEISR